MLRELEGIWRGEGRGVYPPHVAEFNYLEEIIIKPLPKPNMWELKSITKHKGSGKPMHSEMGYIRYFPTENDAGTIEFCLVHPFGVTEVSEGEYRGDNKTIEVHCSGDGFTRTKSAKAPYTIASRRVYTIEGESCSSDYCLHFIFDMATTSSPLQNHLEARLYKVIN